MARILFKIITFLSLVNCTAGFDHGSGFVLTNGNSAGTTHRFRSLGTTARPFQIKRHSGPLMMVGGLKDLLAGEKSDSDGATEKRVAAASAEALARYQPRVDRINTLEKEIEVLRDADLRAKTQEFRGRLAAGTTLDEILEEAFAVVREVAWRVLKMRHYDVQLVAGLVLHEGRLAEMATGEGKTLVASLPTYLAALEGQGTLVVTVNEYLARRDAETIGQIYRFLGLTVGIVQADLETADRRGAYDCDVTFVTNSELGFDFLRDNMALSLDDVVQVRSPKFCLVDEADSILIDEARTPLIISKKVPAPTEKYDVAAKIGAVLKPGKHYEVDLKGQQVTMTDIGFRDAEALVGKSLFDNSDPWGPFILNALKAKELFEADVNYIVRDDAEVCIVDTFTGRIMEGRRWSDGLHQSIEAKENIPVSTESQVMATVTFQALFRQFSRLCGMTGTALSEADEFMQVFGLAVTQVPTALPVARRDYPDAVFKTSSAKIRALIREACRSHEEGRPVLIGTTTVQDSEDIAEILRLNEIEPLVLNAKPENCDREGEVVGQAGRKGAVTVATNMAGRGTDILLGGNPGMMAQLRARDGLAAKGVLEDDSEMRIMEQSFYPSSISSQAEEALETAAASLLEDGKMSFLDLEEFVAIATGEAPINDPAILAIRSAYNAIKKEFSDVLGPEREEVRKMGGLYVLGTQRHESRRIDGQLRGRAGRQGDPGASRFFLSLDDKMLKTFGADRLKKLMDNFRVSEDTPLESKQVSDALDGVQKKVEEYYAGIREQVFEFDDVLDTQRGNVYSRREALLSDNDAKIEERFLESCVETLNDIIPNFIMQDNTVNATGLSSVLKTYFQGIELDLPKMEAMSKGPDLDAYLIEAVQDAVTRKRSRLNQSRPSLFAKTAQYLSLVQLDNNWAEHLKNMNYLKESVVLRQYQGRDVLQEYVTEGNDLFETLLASARRGTVYSLFTYQPGPAKEI